jgi:hypothetical protein
MRMTARKKILLLRLKDAHARGISPGQLLAIS